MEETHITCSQVRPWVRFWARMLDYTIMGLVLYFLMGIAMFIVPVPVVLIAWISFLTPLIWVPIEAWFITMWGATPGKALLQVTVFSKEGGRLHYGKSIHRAFSVWVRGFGLGIPIVNWITMIVAYTKLSTHDVTTWDKRLPALVKHEKVGGGRIVLYIVLVIAIWIAYSSTMTLAIFTMMPPSLPY